MRIELDHRTYEDGTTGLTLSLDLTATPFAKGEDVVVSDYDPGPWLLAFERMVLRNVPEFRVQDPPIIREAQGR